MKPQKNTTPVVRYRGGPLDGRAVPKGATAASPAYQDHDGRNLTRERGDFIVSGRTVRGVDNPAGVYRHSGFTSAPDGRRVHVYDWQAWAPAPAPAPLDGLYTLVGSATLAAGDESDALAFLDDLIGGAQP